MPSASPAPDASSTQAPDGLPPASSPPERETADLATSTDPEQPLHLDGPGAEYEIPRHAPRGRKGRTVEILLRSSPPGAAATVDGVPVGPTPSLWEGVADGSAHEFSFALPGYFIAHYRFVPTQSGIVHGTLEPIKTDVRAPGKKRAPDHGDAAEQGAAEQRAGRPPAGP